MRLLNHANLPASLIAEIETELSNQENLQDVIRWALSHHPGTFLPEVVGAVVVQDEFTHDVIVPWRDGLVLVYDTT
jgi:hypothetical protein